MRRTISVLLVLGGGAAGCAEGQPNPTFPHDGGGGFGGGFGGGKIDGGRLPSGPQPSFGATETYDGALPPVSGGTLRVLRDGRTAVAADPDRDRVFVVDLPTEQIRADIPMQAGDEPGRHVEDSAGRVHVALRRGGAVVTLDAATWTVIDRRSICPGPRGLAYDVQGDRLHVACAGGELVSLPAAGGSATRTLHLERDLRDVVVDGDRLLVSLFRAATVLVIEADGHVSNRLAPPSFASPMRKGVFSPSVAWRMIELPNAEVAMVHQRALSGEVGTTEGGYGGQSPCDSIVHSTVTRLSARAGGTPQQQQSPIVPQAVLAVDVGASQNGDRLAVVSYGNGRTDGLPRLYVGSLAAFTNNFNAQCPGLPGTPDAGLPVDGGEFGGRDGGSNEVPPPPGELLALTNISGEPTAVAFDGQNQAIVQTRDPASLQIPSAGRMIVLSKEGRRDTGHAVFHSNAGGFIACASCHPEGGEDGRTWQFAGVGARRTQSTRGGLSGSEPFHWNGDMRDLNHLLGEVFVGRMSGPRLLPDQVGALSRWVDRIPHLTNSAAADPDAVARGRGLFESTGTSCATCHAGSSLTNNTTIDVGTGGSFQVPSLRGVGWRAPFIHQGCAATLRDRFSATCGGGDKHGRTSHLSGAQLDDLTAYLESL